MNHSSPNQAANKASHNDSRAATGVCPFQKLAISIVPVRYAIDEQVANNTSNADQAKPSAVSALLKNAPFLPQKSAIAAQGKHPLPNNGLWQPWFQSNGVTKSENQVQAPFTLRQLRDGWLYVYSEQGKTFHEYKVEGTNFIKIDWSNDDLGKDDRGTSGTAASHLSYPANQVLHLAFAHQRWSWRVCEHMRSNNDSRASWMRTLSLPDVATSKKIAHCTDIKHLGELTADIDTLSGIRFAQTCTPLFKEDIPEEIITPPLSKNQHELVAAKPNAPASKYTNTIPCMDSAVMIALDDPLADVCDLYQLLAPEWAELNSMQEDHKLQMATVTEQLALPQIDEQQLPPHLHDDMRERLKFKRLVMEHAENWKNLNEAHAGSDHTIEARQRLKRKHLQETALRLKQEGFIATPAQLNEWQELLRYQNDINWQGIDNCLNRYDKKRQQTQQRIILCHQDLRNACEQLGSNPIYLGLDNQQTQGQDYLQTLFSEILPMLSLTTMLPHHQEQLTALLTAEKADNFFVLAIYGFDTAVYDAIKLETLDNPLFSLSSSGDITALASRLAEWDSLNSDSRIQNSKWYQTLTKPVRFVLEAMSGAGKATAGQAWQQMLSVLLPHQLSNGPITSLRMLLLQTLIDPSLQLKGNKDFAKQQTRFRKDWLNISKEINDAKKQSYSGKVNQSHYENHLNSLYKKLDAVLPYHAPWLIKFEAEELNSQARNIILNYLAKARHAIRAGQLSLLRSLNAMIPNLGSVGGGLALVNIWNIQQVITNLTATAQEHGTAYALRELTFTITWTGNAIAALYQGSVWNTISKQHSKLLKQSLSQALSTNKTLITSFIKTMGVMSGLGMMSAGLEAWHNFSIANDTNSLLTEHEKTLYRARGGVLIAQVLTFGSQLVLMSLNMTVGAIFAPWMLAGLVVLGLLYIGISMFINKYKQNAMEKWFRQSTWGVKTAGWDIETELYQLNQELYQPSATVKDTSKESNSTKKGYQLELRLPHYLLDQSLGLEITTTPIRTTQRGSEDLSKFIHPTFRT